MKTQLAVIPTKVSTSVIPKPTKNEVVKALTLLRIEQIEKEQEQGVRLREKLVKDANAALRLLFLDGVAAADITFDLGSKKSQYVKGKWREVEGIQNVKAVSNITKLPKDITDMLLQIHSLPTYVRVPDRKVIEKQIRAVMDGATQGDRVQAIIGDKESRAALETILNDVVKPLVSSLKS